MVVAKQMQDAMQQQKAEFLLKRNIRFSSVSSRCVDGDNDITQDIGTKVPSLPLLHGKGDDVGRPVALQIVSIDLPDAGVVNQQNGQLGLRTSRDV